MLPFRYIYGLPCIPNTTVNMLASLLASLLSFAAQECPTMTAPNTCFTVAGTDYIDNFPVETAPSPVSFCCAACASDTACVAYQYVVATYGHACAHEQAFLVLRHPQYFMITYSFHCNPGTTTLPTHKAETPPTAFSSVQRYQRSKYQSTPTRKSAPSVTKAGRLSNHHNLHRRVP